MKISLLVICLGCIHAMVKADSWYERKRNYKPQKLRANRLTTITQMSDGSQFDYFKENILRPFLRIRVPGTEGNRLVQQHIISQMTGLGWTIELDNFTASTPMGEKPFTNIVAVKNPSSTRHLTFACHFDSKYFAEFDFIGATDSAVPCAMLIDMARHLNSSLSKVRRSEVSLKFIFFDGEEAFERWTPTDSIYGARHLAAKMEHSIVQVDREVSVSELQTIDLFVLLDLIGTRDTFFTSYFPATNNYFERFQKIESRLSRERLLEDVSTNNKYFTGVAPFGGIGDDHVPFLERNVPVLHLISHPFPSVWHTALDNEAALHYPTINNIGKILRIFVIEYLHLSL